MKKSPSRFAYCLDHGGVAVARRRDGNPGHEVQVAVAIDIFDDGALTVGHGQGILFDVGGGRILGVLVDDRAGLRSRTSLVGAALA